MPRYFFNIYDGKSVIDEDGMVLADIIQARRMAVRMAGQLFDDESEIVALGQEWRMEVTDDKGLILFRLDFLVTDSSAIGTRIHK